VTKGVLGRRPVLMCSRYHAIISALSQGTSMLGTLWCHEYDEPFRECGCTQLLVCSNGPLAEVRDPVRQMVEPPANTRIARRAVVQEQEI
jgi:hypothetical protein